MSMPNHFKPIETDFTTFAFTIPFEENVSKIRIMMNNTTMAEIIPTTKLLRDAIELLPDTAFEKDPEKSRELLLKKADSIEKMLGKNNTKAALSKLKHNFRKSVNKLLLDFVSPDVSILNKSQILQLVDNIILRLSLTNQ